MADADKLYQDALNQINAVNTPNVNDMQLRLQAMVQQGIITPEQMQAALVDKNAYDSITTNPQYTQAQQNALAQMQDVAESGGLTPIDKAQLQDIQDTLNTTAKGREDAIIQNMKERGVMGGGMELSARLANAQAAGDQASRAGLDVAAQAQQRALAAMQEAGTMGTNLRNEQFQEGATKAGAQNAIDMANAQMTNAARATNVANNNAAQAQNLAESQRISDANTAMRNEEQQYNKSLAQQDYENKMAKANAAAGIYGNWASTDAKKQQQKTGFQNAVTAGLIQTGAKAGAGAMTGGAAPAAGGASAMETAPAGHSPNVAPNQYASLGYSKGGKVPGNAPVPGDSPANDVVPAKLSPGEVVVPRSAAEDPDLLKSFVGHMKGEGKPKKPKAKEVDHMDIAKVFKALAEMKGGK